jgi:hypothetical protein
MPFEHLCLCLFIHSWGILQIKERGIDFVINWLFRVLEEHLVRQVGVASQCRVGRLVVSVPLVVTRFDFSLARIGVIGV